MGRKDVIMVVAEISIIPIGTETTSVSRYVSAAIKEIEASGLKWTVGPMGTTIEADSIDEVYAAIARAQAVVFDLGAGRAYTMDGYLLEPADHRGRQAVRPAPGMSIA